MSFYQKARETLDAETDIQTLSSLIMVTLATSWEGFLSDLFVAYINRDSSKFINHLKNAFKEPMSEKQKHIHSLYAPFKQPRNINRTTISSLLVPNGNNITFSDCKDLKKCAQRWLSHSDQRKISALTKKQGAIINLWVALRNHIVHDSERSRKALKDAVSKRDLYRTGLHRQQNAVGTPGFYLKSNSPQLTENSRIEEIAAHMKNIAKAI